MDQFNWIFINYPLVRYLAASMFIFRIVFKPFFSILGKYVELTVEEEDNKKLHDFMKTKKYKMMVFIVDLLASVKLPKVKEKGKYYV